MYKWIGADGGWKIGTPVEVKSPLGNWTDGFGQQFQDRHYILMRQYHTGQLEWVESEYVITPYEVPPEFK